MQKREKERSGRLLVGWKAQESEKSVCVLRKNNGRPWWSALETLKWRAVCEQQWKPNGFANGRSPYNGLHVMHFMDFLMASAHTTDSMLWMRRIGSHLNQQQKIWMLFLSAHTHTTWEKVCFPLKRTARKKRGKIVSAFRRLHCRLHCNCRTMAALQWSRPQRKSSSATDFCYDFYDSKKFSLES